MFNMTDDYHGDVQRPPALQDPLNTLSKAMTGQDVQPNTCSACGKVIDLLHLRREFKDELSLREWHISHMCQRCQDEFFEQDDDSDFEGDDNDYSDEDAGWDNSL